MAYWYTNRIETDLTPNMRGVALVISDLIYQLVV